jgi:3-hydroxybutyryl-CoA dehydrogenase
MTASEINKVAVIGAGTMGPGMAATFARNGFDTTLYDVKSEQLEKAKSAVDFVYTILTGGGFMTAQDADTGRGLITYTTDLTEALTGADFVVETVPEQKELKQQVFQDLERARRRRCHPRLQHLRYPHQ